MNFRFPYKLAKAKSLYALKQQITLLNREIAHSAEFIQHIEAGKLNVELPAEDIQQSKLLQSLHSMQQQLQKIAGEEKARKWATEGLARFVEILRSDQDDISKLADRIISNLVDYLGANQGGLFILNTENEEEPYLELVSCYAYERKKFLEKRIEIGEGMVGQTFLEKETTCLTEVPENYLNITSGMGKATPGSLLVVPLKINEEIYGIIELASFKKFKPHQISFIEKLGESIASSVSMLKVNARTRKLLKDSQEQTEMMRAQEEEMRQNNEELMATQEEMARKQNELEEMLKRSEEQAHNLAEQEKQIAESQTTIAQVLDNLPLAVYWKDISLNISGCNVNFYQKLGIKNKQHVIGKCESELSPVFTQEMKDEEREILRTGKGFIGKKLQADFPGVGKRWLKLSKFPLFDTENKAQGLLITVEDITRRMEQEQALREQTTETESAITKIKANEAIMKKAVTSFKSKEKKLLEKSNQAKKLLEEAVSSKEAMQKSLLQADEREQLLQQQLAGQEAEILELKRKLQAATTGK